MKKIFFQLALLLIQMNFWAQVPTLQWQKCFGGTANEGMFTIQPTADGGYIIAGATSSTNGTVSVNHGHLDAWVIKINNTGDLQWQNCYGGTEDERFYSIQPTADGGYIMVGDTNSSNGDATFNHGNLDGWVVKISNTGSLEWQKSLGGTSSDQLNSIRPTVDGGYIIAGESNSSDGDVFGSHGNTDAWVVKINSIGNLEWQKSLGGTNLDNAKSIQLTSDGNYIMAGLTSSTNGDVSGNSGFYNAWVVKISTTGNILWQKCLGGMFDEYATCIEPTTNGGYIMTGYTNSNNADVSGNHGLFDAWVVKLNSTGSLEWQKCLGGTNYDYGYSIQLTPDGGYVMSGSTFSTNGDVSATNGSNEAWIVKLSNTGNLQWQKCLGGTQEEEANSVLITSDGGYIVAGQSYSNDGDVSGNNGFSDAWIVKLNPDILSNTNFGINTLNIYPNPSSSLIVLQNPENSLFDKIAIVDLTGKVVLTKTASNQINIEQLACGIYSIEAYSGNDKFTCKFAKK